MADAVEKIINSRIVAIIRGANSADIIKIANALLEGGIKVLEITLNTTGALVMIEELNKKLGDRLLIGAGTVLSAEAVGDAVTAGAKFIISPSFDPAVVEATKRLGVTSIPGAFTPTEIFTAFKKGGDIIKVFPASGASQYINEIRGPFPEIPLLPTGGINLQNIHQYLEAGAVAVGIGSALVNTRLTVTKEYLDELKKNAARYVTAIEDLTKSKKE